MSEITIAYSPLFTRAFWLAVLMPVMVLLSFIRNYSALALSSAFGLFAAVFAIIFTVYDAATFHETKELDTYPR
jgi:amino acid permease